VGECDGYFYIGPGQKDRVIGVVYDPSKGMDFNLIFMHSGAYDTTQICLEGKGIYTICHTTKSISRYLRLGYLILKEVTREDYDRRLEYELGFLF